MGAGTGAIHLLPQRRMLGRADCGALALKLVRVVDIRQRDTGRIRTAQRELVAAQANLDRIAHGRVLHHGHLGARRKAHVEDMLTKRLVVRVNRRDDGVLADLQMIEAQGPCASFGLRPVTVWLSRPLLLVHYFPSPTRGADERIACHSMVTVVA